MERSADRYSKKEIKILATRGTATMSTGLTGGISSGVNGELKNAAEESEIMQLPDGQAAKEGFIDVAMANPHIAALTGGGPALTDSNGIPWTAAYVTAKGDLTVALRSNIASESRAKIVYEYFLKFTDDPLCEGDAQFSDDKRNRPLSDV